MLDAPRATAFAEAVVCTAAYALCDGLHELAHVAAAVPLNVSVLTISSVGISTATTSAPVALAGPAVNAFLAVALLAARSPALSTGWRRFAWLFGTLNLFDCVAYLLYSAILGSGDWATVLDALAPADRWRPIAGLVGVVLYAVAVVASLRVLRTLIAERVTTLRDARRFGRLAYFAGGLLLTAAAALNPISPWLILTSGVATGFGAMAGLVYLPAWLKQQDDERDRRETKPSGYGPAWVVGSATVSLAFVFGLGPGLQITPVGAPPATVGTDHAFPDRAPRDTRLAASRS